ncbi:MAG: YfhO family protein [Acholeplasmatales bacterium]|nr:YfhO family protein [Acholeplasmatales bacterium]
MDINKPEEKNTNPFKYFFHRLKNIWKNIWESKLYTFALLASICVLFLILLISYTSYLGGIYHFSSDDILQYYPYVDSFFKKIKDGSISLYDKGLLIGTSWFSGAYYIPLDFFTWIAFFLSYILPNEVAYNITVIARVCAGSMIFYYFLVRHHTTKTSFIGALILLISGMTQTYFIFTVYVGIIFYAPLAMLVVDLVIEKQKKWFFIIPIYILSVVLFDFYMAYMLIAFMCFYLVIKLHIEDYFSIWPKRDNFIFKNKTFWILFIKYMAFVLLGVIISMFFLLPSALYIVLESNRSQSKTEESMWYFCKSRYDDKLYIAHYFLQIINLYIPNETHQFCLTPGGAYIREHASLYITSGALIYLVYFFLIRKDRIINRYKFWVLAFNVAFFIPIFSRLMCLNNWPYVRWFFIPLMLNLYASCLAMDKNNLKIDKPYLKFVPMFVLAIGMALIIFVLKTNTSLFIHYDKDDEYFYYILIPALIFNAIYILLLLASFILDQINRHHKIIIKSIPILMASECIFAFALIYDSANNASTSYNNKRNNIERMNNNLVDLYGYNEASGYRINMYTSTARNLTNASILYGVNYGKFFQSFYNTNFNVLMTDIFNDSDSDWSRNLTYGYNLITGPLFNIKYVATNENINLPLEYYNLYVVTYSDNTEYYYEVKDDIPFIVYDKAFTSVSNMSFLEKHLALLDYAYIKIPAKNESNIDEKYFDVYYDNYNYLNDINFKFYDSADVINSVSPYIVGAYTSYSNYVNKVTLTNPETKENSSYFYYNFDNYINSSNNTNYVKEIINNSDALYIYPSDVDDRRLNDGWMYLKRENGNLFQGHHNIIYINHDYDDYSSLSVYAENVKNSSKSAVIQGFNFDVYDNFISNQNEYRNKEYSFKGSKMKIKFDMDKKDTPIIIKTGYAYSNSWEVSNSDYETICVDGSFLGIVVPSGTETVNISVKYVTPGIKYGIIISTFGVVAYLGLISPVLIKFTSNKIRKRKKQ